MKAEEGEVVVGPAVEGELQVLQQVDDVQGQPADDEHQQHGQQDSASGSNKLITCELSRKDFTETTSKN